MSSSIVSEKSSPSLHPAKGKRSVGWGQEKGSGGEGEEGRGEGKERRGGEKGGEGGGRGSYIKSDVNFPRGTECFPDILRAPIQHVASTQLFMKVAPIFL